jgi:diamine N-acetyltransferase
VKIDFATNIKSAQDPTFRGKDCFFVMYNTQPEADGSYSIYSMMVDARYQGKGYGTMALRLVIERLRQLPHCTTVSLEYDHANEQVARLYRRLGFREVAESPTGGVIAQLHVK